MVIYMHVLLLTKTTFANYSSLVTAFVNYRNSSWLQEAYGSAIFFWLTT